MLLTPRRAHTVNCQFDYLTAPVNDSVGENEKCVECENIIGVSRALASSFCVDFSHPRIVPCQMTHVKKKLAECVLARNTTSSHESRLIEKKVFPHRVWVCAFENTMISTILTERKKFSQQ